MSDAQERITRCWNGAASSYDSAPGHGLTRDAEREAWQRMLRGVLPEPPVDVLDVGTGTGFLAFRAHELGHRATGIDLSDHMLARARDAAARIGEGAPSFVTGDAMAPDLPARSFDAVMNRHLLWTLTDPDRALRAWRGLLRPGGVLVIIDGIWPKDNDDHDDEEDDDHAGANVYTPELLAQLPMTRAESVDDVVRVIKNAGYRDVRPIDLSGIDDAEGHLPSVQGRYGLTARA